MNEFYIVGRWYTDNRGDLDLTIYSYNDCSVIRHRMSAELTVEHCNNLYRTEGDCGEWRLFKVAEVEE